jgi:FdhD protein
MTGSHRLVRIEPGGGRRTRFDDLAPEEPLEIRVGGGPLAVTMRTPGHDFELAAGFLLAEGVVGSGDEIAAIRYCTDGAGPQEYNMVDVLLRPGVEPPAAAARRFVATSACGVCGKATIDSLRVRARHDVAADPTPVAAAVLAALPDQLRAAQPGFDRTGGLHAAGLFDATGGGLVCAREDVGRHNAFDKVIGWAALGGRLPLRGHVILASGRAGFELTQKALVAGIPVVAAVSAPSSLAVRLARESGMTLVGFLRGGAMNVYAGEERVV